MRDIVIPRLLDPCFGHNSTRIAIWEAGTVHQELAMIICNIGLRTFWIIGSFISLEL